MKVKAKNLFYEALPSTKDKKKLLAEQGMSMSPGPKIPGLRNSIKGLPDDYFDYFDKIKPSTDIHTVPTYDPTIPSPAEGITPPGLSSTPPGMITPQQPKPKMPGQGGNIGNAALLGIAAFDALLPNRYQKQQVVTPTEMYNPYKYGTGSQALMQSGGSIPTRQDIDARAKWFKRQKELSDSLKQFGPNPDWNAINDYYDKYPRLRKISEEPPPQNAGIEHKVLGPHTNQYQYTESRVDTIYPLIQKDRNIPPTQVKGIDMVSREPIKPSGKQLDFSQKPTKYSATYRDETSDSKDRTIYFKDKESWKAFVNSPQYKYTSTSETSDSATSAGYKMQQGGVIPLPRTDLSPQQDSVYNQWKSRLPKNLQYEGDYNLKQLWLDNPGIRPSSNMHFPDTYKMPNHPTFSDQSMYFNPSNQYMAGHWNETDSSFNYIPYNPQYKKSVIEKKQSGGKIDPEYTSFFSDYIKSPKYKERLKTQGYSDPDQVIKDRLGSLNSMKIKQVGTDGPVTGYLPSSNTIISNKEQLREVNFPYESSIIHEISHGTGALNHSDNRSLNMNEWNQFLDRGNFKYTDPRTLPEDKRDTFNHDIQSDEIKADMDAFRYKLHKDGVYETGHQNFDKKTLDKVKKKYSKDAVIGRFMSHYSDDDIIYLMNNIAGEQSGTPNAYTGAQIMSVERDYPIVIPEGAEDNMPSAKSGNWIQGAVNPKHKGYCTPMTKKTCTPRRKALARTFKKYHGFHEDGGEIHGALQYENIYNNMMEGGGIIPDPMSVFNPHTYEEGGNVNGGAKIREVGAYYPNSDLLEQWLLYKNGGNVPRGTYRSVGPYYPNTDLLEQWIPWDTGEYEQGGNVNGGAKLNYVGATYPNSDLLEQWLLYNYGGEIPMRSGGQLSAAKAKEMLRDGTAQGHKLTAKQKRYFGYIAGGGKAQAGAAVTRDPYYESSARLLHYKDILNDKLKAKNPQAYSNYFKGLSSLRKAGDITGAQKYVQDTSYNEYLNPDEVKSTLGNDYNDYINSLKQVNTYNVQQGMQPLYGQVEGEQDINNLNYGRRFASLMLNPTLNVTNQSTGHKYARNYNYNPKTKSVDFTEEGDLNLRPSYVKPPQTSASLRSGGSVNSTGYRDGFPTARNSYNVIPSEFITMKGVSRPIVGRPIRKGQLGEAITMSPGEEYRFPGADGVFEYPMYQQGGEIGTMWGGNAEMESYNPYDGGTVAFNGASHEDGGIGMHYNGNPVEVEGGEYASQDGEGNLNIYGNMYLPGTRTKFKSVAKAMAGKEKRYDFLKTKGSELVDKSNPANKYEQLTFNAGRVMMEGGRIGQKDIADKKKKLSALQKAMLDTAKEHGLDAQELSQGRVKKDKSKGKARGGASIPFAQDGATVNDPTRADRNNNPGNIKYSKFAQKYGAKKDKDGFAVFPDKQTGLKAMKELLTSKEYKDLPVQEAIYKWTGNHPYRYDVGNLRDKKVSDLNANELETVMGEMRKGEGTKYGVRPAEPQAPVARPKPAVTAPPFTPYGLPPGLLTPDETPKKPGKVVPPPLGPIQIPQRPNIPSNAEPLHLNQLLGELYGAATNRVEPVVAQRYEPQLYSPYQVSFQDRLNKNEHTFNSLQRAISDPGVLSGVAAQKYEADNAIKADEFRTNQAIANDIINKNVALTNDATLKNLAIADNQYVRQSTAKSKTKEMNQLIVNSIASKYAQNDFQNKRLAAYENLYDYRFVPTKDGGQKAVYYGPNAMFNFDPQAAAARQAQDSRTVSRYDEYGNLKGYTQYDESQLEEARKQIDYEMKRRKLPLMEAPKLD